VRLVIPVGRGRPTTLPYVLRSAVENTDVTELVTVGERPKGVEADRHIDSPNTDKPHVNIAGHLRRVCKVYDGEFVWCDDDMFFLKPWVPGVYVRAYSIAGMLRLYPSRGHWSQAVRSSIKVMESWGYDPEEAPCGTIHRPWLVETGRVMRTVEALEAVGGGSFKALYVAGLEGVITAGDPKVVGRVAPRADADMVSVLANSWQKAAGQIVRQRFPTPSRWESTPTEDMAAVGSGQLRGPHRRHRR
jgi:hypothetical protein